MDGIDFTEEFEGDEYTVLLTPKQVNSLLIICQNWQSRPDFFIKDIETLDITQVNDYIEDIIGRIINGIP